MGKYQHTLVVSCFALVFAAMFIAMAVSGCGGGEHQGPKGHHSLLDRLNTEPDTIANSGPASTPWLHGVSYAPVEGVTLNEIEPFFVEDRTGTIGKFPCSECHTVPLSTLKSPDVERPRAHWDVSLNHAASSVMQCSTCHATESMDSLHLLEGERISLNHSYQLCAQCHATQAADWTGGAHGKRRGGWGQPRVVASCTACHNPHSPQWDVRFPARASRVVEE